MLETQEKKKKQQFLFFDNSKCELRLKINSRYVIFLEKNANTKMSLKTETLGNEQTNIKSGT